LRRQEALQPAHPLDLADLLSDALSKLPIHSNYFPTRRRAHRARPSFRAAG